MRITVCGSGAGWVTATRANSCYLLDDGERGLLLDCGPGSLLGIARSGLPFPSASALVVSHLHMDHIHGFPQWLAHLLRPHGVVPRVYGPAGTRAYVEAAAGLTGLVSGWPGKDEGVPLEIPVIEIGDGDETRLPEAGVRSAVVPHAPDITALAHRLAFAGCVITYSGDTNVAPAVMVPLADGADLLIHEAYSEAGLADWTATTADATRRERILSVFAATHSRVDTVAKVAAESGVKRLLLTHLNPGEQPARLAAEARAHFGGEVIVAADGLTLEL
ncbi:MAG: MBL fold metallo-hydrolase [Dehalococcoidia bacterium]|uniref:MBL fold metallo-hydrolase n=1 Tax=Candidatus Amarobacter glycogenicus TaxID=3140699 RepID=UPI00313614BF|nr:MBL fold metallo-hydrolase [Dehalococcoidia bacterium]